MAAAPCALLLRLLFVRLTGAVKIMFLATSGRSPAEELGQLVGTLIGIALVMAVPVFAIVAIVKAFTRRTRGWIIAGCVSGAIVAVPLLVLVLGVTSGLMSARRIAKAPRSAAARSPTEVATALSSPSALESPTMFASRTEAGMALLRKSGFKPSEQFTLAMHNIENAAGRFFTASSMIDTDAVLDPTRKEEVVVQGLQTFENTAYDLVTTIHVFREQTNRELAGSKFTASERAQIAKQAQSGYDHIEAAAATAISAARAGTDLRKTYSLAMPAESARQRFVDAWNAYSQAMSTLVSSAQKTQQRAEEMYRSKP